MFGVFFFVSLYMQNVLGYSAVQAGAAFLPMTAAAMRSVPVDKAGVGSAVLNSFRQVGGSIGIAVMGAIMAHEAGGRRTPQAFMDGFSRSLVTAAAVALVGAIVAFVLVRPHEQEGAEVPAQELAA